MVRGLEHLSEGELRPRRRSAVGVALMGILALLAVGGLNVSAAAAAEACPNEAARQESRINPFTGQPYSAGLPECRAYEMVSPPNKQSHDAGTRGTEFNAAEVVLSPEGTAASWVSQGDFGEPENFISKHGPDELYLSQRGGSGWSTSSAFAPQNLVSYPTGTDNVFDDFTHNLISGRVSCGEDSLFGTLVEPRDAYACAIKHGEGQWEGTPLYSSLENENIKGGAEVAYRGASADVSRVFIQILVPLLPGDVRGEELSSNKTSSKAIYEIGPVGKSAQLRFVNVSGEGGTSASEPLTYPFEGGLGSPHLGGVAPREENYGTDYHAVSESGETVFFEASLNASETASPRRVEESETPTVFARIPCPSVDYSFAKPCETVEREVEPDVKEKVDGRQTIKVSDPDAAEGCAECNQSAPVKPAAYLGAAADGSKVFFATKQKLLNGDETTNLYEYYLGPAQELPAYMKGQRLVDLTAIEEPNGARVAVPGGARLGAGGALPEGVVRTSEDGGYVYFIAKGVMGAGAVSGAENLYGVNTQTGQIKFVAVVTGLADFEGLQAPFGHSQHAQTTPDGRDLVFSSTAKLAGDTNTGEAVYRYDFPSGKLTWVSRGAPGFKAECEAEPNANGEAKTSIEKAACEHEGRDSWVAHISYEGGAFSDGDDFSRAITGCPAQTATEPFPGCAAPGEHDGEDIIFTTKERLQAGDRSGETQLYMWHCPSECRDPETEGVVQMISDGQDTVEPLLNSTSKSSRGESGTTAISASGSDIIFDTRTPLVGQDTDVQIDYYDARIDGGYPAPPQAPACAEETCQPAGPSSPSFQAAPSSVLAAGGNLPPPAGGALAFKTTVKRPETNAQKLAKALKLCEKKPKKKRAACESQARKKYPIKSKSKSKPKPKNKSGTGK